MRRLREHAKGVGASSHFRLPLSTGLTIAGSVRQREIRDMDQNNHGFPTEWDLEEKKAEDQRLDNRDAWALQEERHYQWLEEEYNGVKHRRGFKMDPIYDSPLNPFGIEQEKEVYERYSLKELRDKEKCIENLLREKQADEPSRKRKNKMQYDSWVRSIAEWAAELRQVREEIEKRTSHGKKNPETLYGRSY